MGRLNTEVLLELRDALEDPTTGGALESLVQDTIHAIAQREWHTAGRLLWEITQMDRARRLKEGGSVGPLEALVDTVGHGYEHPEHLARCLAHRHRGQDRGPRVPVEPPPVVQAADLLRIQKRIQYTSGELATYLGVTRGTITSYRSGRTTIDGATARCLVRLEQEIEHNDSA